MKHFQRLKFFVFPLILLSIGLSAHGASLPLIVVAKGRVEVLINPSNKPKGKGPHLIYEKKYYTVKKAKPGYRIPLNGVVKTAINSKAKVVYPDGSHVFVGPGSAIEFRKNIGIFGKSVGHFYGKIRSVVKKLSEKEKFEVNTSSAVMGVRGTDFFVSDQNVNTQLEVTVLSGSVIMKPKAPLDNIQLRV